MDDAVSSQKYERLFAAMLCAIIVIGGVMPRALTVLPAGAALAAFFLYRNFNRKWPKIYWPAFAWVGVLFALMMVTTLWAVDAGEALERTLKTLPILIGGALLFAMTRVSNGTILRKWLPYAVVGACLLCVTQFYMDAPFYFMFHPRPGAEYAGNLFYLNRETSLIVMLTPLAVSCILTGAYSRNIKGALVALVGLMLGAILFKTDSQSAQLAFLIATLIYIGFPIRFRVAWLVLTIALAAGLLAAPWLAQMLYHTIPPLAGENSFLQQSYALQRLEVWDFVARRALERPFMGFGVEATDAIQDFDSKMLYHHSNKATHPHNFAMQLWIEFGVWGALYAAAFFAALLQSAKNMDPVFVRASLAVLFAAISVASTGYGLWQGMWIGAFGLLIALSALVSRK